MQTIAQDALNLEPFIDLQEKGPSERVRKLRARLTERIFDKIQWWGEGLTILNSEEIAKKPVIIRKAKALEKVLTEMPISISDDELIVGTMRMHALGSGNPFPDYATEEEKKEAELKGTSIKSVWGHSVPDYRKVLSHGFNGIREEIEGRIQDSLEKKKRDFYRATQISCDAVIALARRYSVLASKLADKEADQARKEELRAISEICIRVPEYPPRNFHEAVQSFWFTHLALQCTLDYIGCGRIDTYLYPYFEKDVSKGTLSHEQALEIIECLLVKFNEIIQIKEEYREDHSDPYDYTYGANPGSRGNTPLHDPVYQIALNDTATLGGQTESGEESSNELTYLFLEAIGKLELVFPTMHVRLSKKSPEWLLQKSCELIQLGGGIPVLYNDDVIIPAFISQGFPETDARNYSSDGCWEQLIPGRSEFRYSPIHSLKCLEWVFTRGMDNNQRVGLDTGDITGFHSFDELMEAFKHQIDHQIKSTINRVLKYFGCSTAIAPDPLFSALMEGCLEKGQDITEGGAKYIIHDLYIDGVPNAADGLAAIKKFVFEEKSISLERLRNALINDYKGEEELRQKLIKRAPKFGNDVDYVDQILVDIIDYFVQRVEEYAKDLTWIKMGCGVGTLVTWRWYGYLTGATPDGRKAREPLASNMSPYFGRDMLGATAVINSVSKVDHRKLGGSAAVDLYLSSKSVSGREGLQRLMGFVKTLLEKGCGVASITVTDNRTLLAAQKEPEKYRNLRVRMGGWHAYFVALNREHQNFVIQRSKHGNA
jgi:pyruvate formate-lyase/glycerol dehydratase family glycyl radical enzyme